MPASSAPERPVTIAVAAARLNVSSKTIRRRIADGTLTAYRLPPRIVRVDMAEVERLFKPYGGSAA